MPDDMIQGEMMLSSNIAPRAPEWIHIAQAGRWAGKGTPLTVGPAHLQSALAYFQQHYGSQGTDLVIDYDHASHMPGIQAPAAGWITDMELREGGTQLWAHAQWNADAAIAIKDRRYRYLSPVIRFNARDRVSGQRTLTQIASVALTNTPFLTELQALNDADTPIEETAMSLFEMLCRALKLLPAALAARLGITEDAEDEIVAKAVEKLIPDSAVGVLDPAPEPEAEAEKPAAEAEPEADAEPDAEPISDADLDAVGQAPEPVDAALSSRVLKLLGLEPDVGETVVCSTIIGLQAQAAGAQAVAKEIVDTKTAQQLLDGYVSAGKVPPAMREFWLNALKTDREATELAMNNLPVLINNTPPETGPVRAGRPDKYRQYVQEVAKGHGMTVEAWMAQTKHDTEKQ